MKSIKATAAALLALACASLASATTTIHIVGSTAFRASVHAAIINSLNSPTAAYSGSNLKGASTAVFAGTLKSGPSAGQSVVFELAWSGSSGGIQTVAQTSPVITKTFPTAANTMSAVSLTGSAGSYTYVGGTVLPGSPVTETVAAEVAMGDSFQGSTIFTGTGYANLNDQVVGVIPFEWVRGSAITNDGTTTASSNFSGVTNMTELNAVNLLNGGLPLSQFTGNVSDQGIGVEVLGRDEDSGTRLVSFAEPGFGPQSTPTQYQPTIGTGTLSGVITALNPWPVNTVNGLTYGLGHSGYSSGGTLATDVARQVTPGLSTFVIAYLGRSDAGTAVGLGATALTYNGVADSNATIQQGQYTFWSYEHVLYKSTLSGVAKDAADLMAKQTHDTDAAQAGVLLSTMAVGRQVEGGPVTFGSPY